MLDIVNELPLAVTTARPSDGRGVRGMRQCVELLGGAIDIGRRIAAGRCTPRFRWAMVRPRGRLGRAGRVVDTAEIAVLLVDDQDLVRSGLRRILRRKDGFVIVAECADGDEVPAAVAQHRPDVVVMDLRMKRIDGIEAIRTLAGRDGPPVLALTTFNEDELGGGRGQES